MNAFDEMVMVAICSKCGKGITPWPTDSTMLSTGVDNEPLWFTLTQREDICNGTIIHVERLAQIRKVADERDITEQSSGGAGERVHPAAAAAPGDHQEV